MAVKSFTASALKNIAKNAPAKVDTIAGRTGPIFGSRLMEIDFTVKNGWHAPVLRDYGNLVLNPQISGFHYGLVVFDHLIVSRDHTKDGALRFFRPDMFLERLAKSRDYLHFAKYDNAELLECLKAFVRDDAASVPTASGERMLLRTTIIGNNNNLSAGPSDEFKLYTFAALTSSNGASKPLKLKADASVRRSWRGGTGELSMGGNYANQIYQERQSRAEGFDRHLWLVDNDAITTAGDSNFFAVVKRGQGFDVVTPSLNGCMMPGIVRDCVIDLLKKDGASVCEQEFTMADMRAAAKSGDLLEAFSTSSASVTRSIGSVWYEQELLNVPVPEDSIAARMKATLNKIQEGHIASEWNVAI